jgi:ATP-dependent DNA ligase
MQGEAIFRHGLEGIISKRRDARYKSGRSLTWLKIIAQLRGLSPTLLVQQLVGPWGQA